MFEDSAEHIGQTHCQRNADNEGHSASPTLLAPHEPKDKQVERNPHRSPRYGCHQLVHKLSAVEVEPEKEVMVKGNIIHTSWFLRFA
jgi:hypothetical protein